LSTILLYLFTEIKSAADDNDLFSYLKLQNITSLSPVAVQLDNYPSSAPISVECLASYPHVMNTFIKANSTLPILTAVERLFSTAGQTLCCRRCKLSVKQFDMFVFLRDSLKNLNCESCTAGLAWQPVWKTIGYLCL